MRLADLCDIHSGYTARSKLEPLQEGGVPAIQLSDVNAESAFSPNTLARYDIGNVTEHHLVRGGEVIFRPRGPHGIAITIPEDMPEPAVAILPLIIIRPDRNRVLPEFVAWAINQPRVRHALSLEAQGSIIRTIPVRALEQLDITVPDKSTQRRIVVLDALRRQEKQLLHRLAERRERLFGAILEGVARNANQEGSIR